MRKRGTLTRLGLLEHAIQGRERALAKAKAEAERYGRRKGHEADAARERVTEIERELTDLRARLAAMPAEEAQ